MDKPKRRPMPGNARKPEGTHMVRIGATIRPDQHAQFVALGGSKWLRSAIDAAPTNEKIPRTQ